MAQAHTSQRGARFTRSVIVALDPTHVWARVRHLDFSSLFPRVFQSCYILKLTQFEGTRHHYE